MLSKEIDKSYINCFIVFTRGIIPSTTLGLIILLEIYTFKYISYTILLIKISLVHYFRIKIE